MFKTGEKILEVAKAWGQGQGVCITQLFLTNTLWKHLRVSSSKQLCPKRGGSGDIHAVDSSGLIELTAFFSEGFPTLNHIAQNAVL